MLLSPTGSGLSSAMPGEVGARRPGLVHTSAEASRPLHRSLRAQWTQTQLLPKSGTIVWRGPIHALRVPTYVHSTNRIGKDDAGKQIFTCSLLSPKPGAATAPGAEAFARAEAKAATTNMTQMTGRQNIGAIDVSTQNRRAHRLGAAILAGSSTACHYPGHGSDPI